MRGKTNILPMVGGYINAPIQNETAGEALQLGDLVQRSYSDLPQQITQNIPVVMINTKPLKMFNGKFVYFLSPNSAQIKVMVVEKSSSSFTSTEFTLFTVSNTNGVQVDFVPVNNTTFIVFARTGYGSTSYPYVYYCKKVVYDGTDFTVTDITYDNFPDISYNSNNFFSRGWCIGNGGTLFVSVGKAYYLVLSNDTVSVYGGTDSVDRHLIYLSQQDVFLAGGTTYNSIKFSNGVLIVSSGYSTTISNFEVFGNYIVGVGSKQVGSVSYITLQLGSVDDNGIITVEDEYVTTIANQSYISAKILVFSNFFVLGLAVGQQSSAYRVSYYFKSFSYSNGFVLNDETNILNVSTPYSFISCVDFEGDSYEGGFVANWKNSYSATSSSNLLNGFVFQGMRGMVFADADSNYTMVKAISKIEGVVKRGGSTGDTVEIYVPQVSS